MSWNKINSLTAECPECASETTFVKEPRVGQVVFCAICGTKLEVAYLRPIMLDYAFDDYPDVYKDTHNDEIDFDDDGY